MIYLAIAGLFIAVMCAVFLVESGYDGGYDDLLVGIMVQSLFVGSFCVIFVGFGIFHIAWLYTGIGLSFALLGAGYLAWRNPFYKPGKKEENRIKGKIRKTRQYKEYKAFVKANGDRIGAVLIDFNVLYAPKGVSFFTGREWNPELGDPAVHYYSDETQGRGWQRKTFFQVMPGETGWSESEKPVIMKMMIELLPGTGSGRWNITGEAIRNLPR